jgi:hypothetical protein
VVEVDERAPGDEEPFEWIRERARDALAAAGEADTVVVIGKSLGSAAATVHAGPAVWLTPLLDQADIAEALRTTEAPALLVGSPADPSWGQGRVPENPALEVLELPGSITRCRSAALLLLLSTSSGPSTERVSSFLARSAGTP